MNSSVEAPDVSGLSAVYINCPRCGLSIGLRSRWLAIRHCPRCIARAHVVVEMFSSPLPSSALYASDSIPPANGNRTQVN
jgi:hypothetical protein